MRFLKRQTVILKRRVSPIRFMTTSFTGALVLVLSACGDSAHIPAATASGPQLYMTPVVAGGDATRATALLATYSIDDGQKTFAQATYSASGKQVHYSGSIAPFQRGLLSLAVTKSDNLTTQVTNGWAFELAGQAGGLVALQNQPFAPMVPAVSCPAMTNPETFLFVTLPAPLTTGAQELLRWNPQTETAYGSVDIGANGSTVTLNNISQHTLPSSGGTGAPANPSPTSVTGSCSPTPYGNTVSIPGEVTITNPGNGQKVTPQALLGIGPSGLLVEDNGMNVSATPLYENALGAGSGAIGLPKPSASVDTGSLTGAQYLGFFYGTGTGLVTSPDWSTSLASFGFSSLPASCASIAPQTGTMLYGGDFTNNDPTTSMTGYGNCDFAIDLGLQDTKNNGLYPSATVYVGSGFGTNTTGKTYSFPAVAIAGQLNGKYAIFLIGVDTVAPPNQAWGIYLLQSN